MPLFVRAFGYEVFNSLLPTILKTIPKLTTAGTQATTKALLLKRQGGPWLVVRDGKLLERLP